MKKTSLCLLGSLVAFVATNATAAADTAKGPTIKKCQDVTGKWHYGDSAAEACARSKVTVINEQGITKKEIAAPLSSEELRQRDENAEASAKAKEEAKERAKQDELLLATYSHEADIAYIRDRKIAQLESMVRASNDTLTPLRATLGRLEAQAAAEQKAGNVSEQTTSALAQTRQQIGKHESVVAQKRQEQEQIRARAAEDLARYRALKTQPQKSADAKR